MFHNLLVVIFIITFTFNNASRQKRLPTNDISCKNLTDETTTTTLAPSQSPTAYFPKSYPGKIPSPCIKLRIRLQTENLLPVNIHPDPVSNIAVIGRAIANVTGGVINVPETPEFDEGDDYDPNLVWEFDEGCEIDNQITDTFLESVEWKPSGDMIIERDVKYEGLTLTKPFQTPASIAYKFHIDSVPLRISHDCKYGYLRIQAGIYQDDDVIAYSKMVKIYANKEPDHEFKFKDTVILDSNTSYEIRYKLLGGYPPYCSFDDLYIGNGSNRRRLQDDVTVIVVDELLSALGVASACVLGQNLAASEEMERGITAMCGGANTQEVIEEGLFRQHASSSALKNHLFKAGSLTVFDANDDVSFFEDDFPQFDVEDPCLTVDDENRIVFAVGGRTASGSAVDRIQLFQFDDDTLSSGQFVDEFDNWTLDEPRYGSSCLYWKDDNNVAKLVVISGMEHSDEEFQSRSNWHKDIRIFPLPSAGFIPPSFPIGETKTLTINMIDSKPMLVDNHDLYLFGGKTHRASKPYVSRFDLNDISNANAYPVLHMELTEDVALPLVDKVFVDDGTETKCCYMIFGGQQYESSEEVGDVNINYLQFFCNENMEDECEESRRRLSENHVNIPQWTEFDMEHLVSSETMDSNRRNLGSSSSSDDYHSKEILIRDYNYWQDNVWYNFTVESEICFADCDELRNVVRHYELLIASKPYGDPWLDYANILSETLLNVSLDSYRSWSDGFGAVHVLDLEIVDVHCEDTMAPTLSPTKKPLIISKQERKDKSDTNVDSESDSDSGSDSGSGSGSDSRDNALQNAEINAGEYESNGIAAEGETSNVLVASIIFGAVACLCLISVGSAIYCSYHQKQRKGHMAVAYESDDGDASDEEVNPEGLPLAETETELISIETVDEPYPTNVIQVIE